MSEYVFLILGNSDYLKVSTSKSLDRSKATYWSFIMGTDGVTLGDDAYNPLSSNVSIFRHVEYLLIGKVVEGVHDSTEHQ
jgi:hypothetical protein